MKRRALLALGAALAAQTSVVGAEPRPLVSPELSPLELRLPGDPAFGRALLLLPRQLAPNPPLLILLHGLGETHDQSVGARAFAERYGLLSAVSRLTHPPLVRSNAEQDYFGAGRLAELNERLRQRPFRAPVLVCPFTPNPYKAGGDAMLERYVRFLSGALKAEVEQRVGVVFPASRCMLGGVSLGGYLALEAFVRRPELYCGLCTAQAAFGPGQASRYAAAIEAATKRVGPRRVELLTSSFDPYRRPNELFHQNLQKRGLSSRLRTSPGPHDQRWLNESGVIEMLLSADDVFAEQAGVEP